MLCVAAGRIGPFVSAVVSPMSNVRPVPHCCFWAEPCSAALGELVSSGAPGGLCSQGKHSLPLSDLLK